MNTRRGPTRRRGARLALLTAALAAIGLVAIVATRLASGDDPQAGDQRQPRLGNWGEPGVSHVHGLGVNPADGSLVVATHLGSFRIPPESNEATRIGASFQDTMGFTVAGPDHFLGSGHPDLQGAQAGQPSQLGLIESVDGGHTWRSLSLSGEVDFHGLVVAHDRVYGWDSGTGRFMVSADRATWETRSTINLFGFAVDPRDADHILGAAPDALTESTDGGRTWAVTDGPAVVTITWDADAGLWAADASHTLWHHTSAWQKAGTLPGEPQALLATPQAIYAAVHDENQVTSIHQSTDSGRSWNLRYRDSQP